MDTPTGPKGQDHGHAALYRVHFVVKRFHRFCTGCTGTCGSDRYFPGTAEISYMRGLKPIFHPDRIYVYYQYVYDQREVLVSFWIFSISREGLQMAVFMAIRLILLIIGSSLLTLTTKPISLTDGMEALLSPFKRFGLPAHDLAMMMTIALRFIPTLLEETDKIMKAQMARGADFESGNILRRAKALIPILVPLFISAFRIAQDLAMAMEARCYGSNSKKTRMNGMKICSRDIAACLIFAAFLAMIILERILL